MSKFELLVRSIKKRGFINTIIFVYNELAFDLIHKTDTKTDMEKLDYSPQLSDTFFGPYQGANPWIVNLCIKELKKLGLDTRRASFLDIGSGKGRVMILAAIAGFEQITGVELNDNLCHVAKRNLETTQARLNTFSQPVICNVDAALYVPPEELNVAFMYNTFGAGLMRLVIRNLIESRLDHGRAELHEPLYIIYLHPVYAKVFDEFNLVPVKNVFNEALIYKIV